VLNGINLRKEILKILVSQYDMGSNYMVRLIRAIKKRTEANNRMVKDLKTFQALTSQSNYNEILLCQIKNQKRDNAARCTVESLVIYLQLIVGTMVKKRSSLTEIILKCNSMKLPTLETLKRSLLRALWSGIMGALSAFVLIPIMLENPKQYLTVLVLGLATGFLSGLQKFISGYVKYDVKK